MYFFHQKFVLSKRWTHFSICTPKIKPFKIWTFSLKNPEIWTSQNNFLHIIPNPNWTKKAPKILIDPHLDHGTGVHILLVDATCRCFDFSCYHFGHFFKNSSMELVVIWGNFSCTDLACSDLACSDLACSDLAHSDLARSDLGCFFCQNS